MSMARYEPLLNPDARAYARCVLGLDLALMYKRLRLLAPKVQSPKPKSVLTKGTT